MHRNHPQTDDILRIASHSAHSHVASERIRRVAGRTYCRSDIATTARPETHQNLIHPDKEQRLVHRGTSPRNAVHRAENRDGRTALILVFLRDERLIDGRLVAAPILGHPDGWWR